MAKPSLTPADFLDLTEFEHADLFDGLDHPWQVLPAIAEYVVTKVPGDHGPGKISSGAHVGEHVYLGQGTVVEPGATIQGPAILGRGCRVRGGAYVRSNVLAGDGVMMGNSCEFKNCVLLNGAEVPHFNYVGDSVLGVKAHLGAGVILSNVRLDRGDVKLLLGDGESLDTGMRKFGAIVGDHAGIGCNSVLSPGSAVGPRSILYPGTQWSGYLPEDRIVKLRQQHEVVERK